MKIQIDTENKLIRFEESINLGSMVELLDKMFPFKEWHELTLDQSHIIAWSQPLIIEKTIQPYQPFQPWSPWQPWYTTCQSNLDGRNGDTNKYNLNSGVYNLDLKLE